MFGITLMYQMSSRLNNLSTNKTPTLSDKIYSDRGTYRRADYSASFYSRFFSSGAKTNVRQGSCYDRERSFS